MLALGALAPECPEAVVGFHCDPKLPWDTVGLRYGPSNASFDILTWHITGRGGHGAYPQPVSYTHLVLEQHPHGVQRAGHRRIVWRAQQVLWLKNLLCSCLLYTSVR